MQWPTAEMMSGVCPLADGYRYEVLRQETVAELIAALRTWQPGWVSEQQSTVRKLYKVMYETPPAPSAA